MKNWSLNKKAIFVFSLMIVVMGICAYVIFDSLSSAQKDADITNALGRQRMLSQAMGKAALGNAMAKSRKQNIVQRVKSLDHYITQMRGTYTKQVIGPAKENGLAISMDPESEGHPAIPFPATLTRMVNAKFGAGRDFTIDIISPDPVNPDKGLITDFDKEAYEFLAKKSKSVFTRTFEMDDKLYIRLYTADKATVQVCADCHIALKGKPFAIGDILGIRKYNLLFSADIARGKEELTASLTEFDHAKQIFKGTLNAMRKGGEYPADMGFKESIFVNPINNEIIQDNLAEVDKVFTKFLGSVDNLLTSVVDSPKYRDSQQEILGLSNELRDKSNKIVDLYNRLANENQKRIKSIVIVFVILILAALISIAYFFSTSVVKPVRKISGVMGEVAKGNFMQENLPVASEDEIGILSETYNTMLGTMQQIVDQAKDIAAGDLSKTYELKGELSVAFGKMTYELRDKQNADIEFKEMATERESQAEDLKNKVDAILECVSAAAKGDLSKHIEVKGESAIGQMGEGLEMFFDNLSVNMKGIANMANDLALSAKEISSSVQDQASVSAEQSASVTEISSTVEELSASSNQVAENADSVARISADSLHDSERGMKAIGSLKLKMDEISEDNQGGMKEIVDLGRKSNEIGKVMEIINNIADQTKLIAFNAAIEASSAGEAGKRFGVVAVEIRQLADNVMDSTGEIQSKIDEIQQAINRLVINSEQGSNRIKEGNMLAGQTIEELERLVDRAKSAADAASQISLSTKQQKTGTEQVLSALKEIVNGTRQSSSAIKQTSNVTHKLSEMSERLNELVSRFKLD
jgi:methyl-accepting chemotaxis protein